MRIFVHEKSENRMFRKLGRISGRLWKAQAMGLIPSGLQVEFIAGSDEKRQPCQYRIALSPEASLCFAREGSPSRPYAAFCEGVGLDRESTKFHYEDGYYRLTEAEKIEERWKNSMAQVIKKRGKKAVVKSAVKAAPKAAPKAPKEASQAPAPESPVPAKVEGRGSLSNPIAVRSQWVPEDRAYRNGVTPELVPVEFPAGVSCCVGMLEGHIAAMVDHFEEVWYCTYFDFDLCPLAREAFKEASQAREWLESQELDRVLVLNTSR